MNDRKIKNYHLYVCDFNDLLNHYLDKKYNDSDIPKWNNVKFLKSNISDLMKQYPLAADGAHPGEKAHKHFAKILYKEIQNV